MSITAALVQNVFGLGAPNDAFARYFAGRSYLNPLTRPEDVSRLPSGISTSRSAMPYIRQ